jgi:hypothetical protein
MSEWEVVEGKDVEGNSCIYLQDGNDLESRELFEFVEPDVMISLPLQYKDYLQAARAEVAARNVASESDDE